MLKANINQAYKQAMDTSLKRFISVLDILLIIKNGIG